MFCSWDTSDNSANKTVATGNSSQQPSSITRYGHYGVTLVKCYLTHTHRGPTVHIPIVDDSMTSSDVTHGPASQAPCDNHGSPTHHVYVSSPTHSVRSSESSTSSSQCSTPTNSHAQQVVQVKASEDDSDSDSCDDDVITQTEKPFSWENLSEVEDKELTVPTMAEPEQVQLTPQQFSILISELSTEKSPSLQEAFRQHKAHFITSSQSRVRQVKENSKQRKASPTNQKQFRQHKAPAHGISKTVDTPKASSRAVQFSSPLISLQDTALFTPPSIHRANSMCVHLTHIICIF